MVSQDMFYSLLGTAKEGIGDIFFLKADTYYHSGVTGEFSEKHGEEQREGMIEEDPALKQKSLDWIARIHHQVRSYAHTHLTKGQEKEMLPFLVWSTGLDPHNLPAVLTTAFVLDRDFGKSDEAIEILKKGIQECPDSWEIAHDLGKLYFERKKNFKLSEYYFNLAIEKSAGQEMLKDTLAQTYYLLAESRRALGKTPEALDAYQKALSSFEDASPLPLKDIIRNKIKEINDSG